MTGVFFSFDGVDGVGKSTQLTLFCEWLAGLGHEVVTCRDPGGSQLGETIRRILLDHNEIEIGARSEMLLYMASRAQLVEEVIKPTLEAGRTVVSDRYLLANVVYQGHAGGLDADDLWRVGAIATGGTSPDLTILLDMPAEQSVQRIERDHDRMESRGSDYLEQVRNGFLREAADHPDTIAVVDASQSIEDVQASIRDAVQPLLDRKKGAQQGPDADTTIPLPKEPK